MMEIQCSHFVSCSFSDFLCYASYEQMSRSANVMQSGTRRKQMDQENIGKFIAALRKEKKLTQEQLAEKLGVNHRSVSRWENGVLQS